ncbi:hypothetical protein T4B_6902 [Trichinella pseudospiralis]|uniref:Uncharacterized protein n=1 Tax=Trichinella pseudospiralis TaxID=6337 RepID=A0A0V1JI86_TRIPS|nr:hypothetical protein T4B_6902 [Trichinella pseudospiralis]KRZ34623.1 hypothetical protein T4C_10063 [Trichinella pseudospiralis]
MKETEFLSVINEKSFTENEWIKMVSVEILANHNKTILCGKNTKYIVIDRSIGAARQNSYFNELKKMCKYKNSNKGVTLTIAHNVYAFLNMNEIMGKTNGTCMFKHITD